MNKLTIFIFSIVCFTLGITEKNLICYYANWAGGRPSKGRFDISYIDPFLCTHIYYAFIGLSSDGKIRILDRSIGEHFQDLNSLKKINPDLKIVVSMGGWGEGVENYSKLASDPDKRKSLAQDALQFIEKYNLDGFDLDWEYPGQRDGADPDHDPANFVKLLKDLKEVLSPKGYLLSAAVSGKIIDVDLSYLVPSISETLDLINIMTYDYRTSNDPQVAHYSPLYKSHLDPTEYQEQLNVASGLQYWLDKGADPAKVQLGIGTYGRSYTLANKSNAELYAPTSGPGSPGPYTADTGSLSYIEICDVYSNWEYIWDDEQKVPHIVSGDQWVGYDDKMSVELKIEYANSKNLGGAFVWSIDIDDFLGTCGDETFPLIRTIKKFLK